MVLKMHEAMLYKQLTNDNVQCRLCKRYCIIKPNETGFCKVRKNINGKLYSLVYAKSIAAEIDPIEKKPFYNFLPGSKVFSIATVGCNFRCLHCQNSNISQPSKITGFDLPPETVVRKALSLNANGIAYTYTEPTIFFEYAYDTAKLAYDKNLYNVFVTNGYMSPQAVEYMNKIDASRIDLKSFRDKFYDEVCGGVKLQNVLDTIKLLHKKQYIELITLLIPTLNDSDDEICELASWIKKLDVDIPLHFTSYYPSYKMTLPPTPLSTLERARKLAMEQGLNYVYTGNIPGSNGEHTFCPECGKIVVKRYAFKVINKTYVPSETGYATCPNCGANLNIVTDLIKYRKKKK